MFSDSNQRTTALPIHKILLVGEIREKLEVYSVILPQSITALRLWEDGKGRIMECSVIQTREPLLYDSTKILLVKENIVEIEVCSVILP